MELKDRERKVDVTKMSPEEVDVLGVHLGDKIRAICDEAVMKANTILNIYGASAKMVIEIAELPAQIGKSLETKKKRGKPYKKANLKQEQLP